MKNSANFIQPVVARIINDDELPNADLLATYIETLKLYANEHSDISNTLRQAIINLPSAVQVCRDMGIEEAKILYESVGWAWKELTGNDIVDVVKTTPAKHHMEDNYWILKNGVIISGENHFTAIKRNPNMFSMILGLDGLVLAGALASFPNKAIYKVIANGAIRVFVDGKKTAYFQMTDTTYADWGRHTVVKLDFPKKIVKLIDTRQPYSGWQTGIVIDCSWAA